MKRVIHTVIVAVLAIEAIVVGQGADVARVLADVRRALGGDEKIAAVKTISAVGRTSRTRPDGTSSESEFELSVELPDKYMKRDVVMAMGPTSVYRHSGFNGDGLINEIDTPPSLSSGGMIRMVASPGNAPGQSLSPEQRAEANRKLLVSSKQEFARLALGMFASSFDAYPIAFTYAGQAESADGKADVLEGVAAGDFKVKFFIDEKTRLPLMLSWMDKEPLVMTMGPGGAGGSGQAVVMGGGAHVQTFSRGSGAAPSEADIEKMRAEAEARMKEAEAKRRVVEYRLF